VSSGQLAVRSAKWAVHYHRFRIKLAFPHGGTTIEPDRYALMFLSSALSDVGRRREVNEDFFILNRQYQLFLLADGMGGHTAGEVASELAANTVERFVLLAGETDELTWPFGYSVRLPYEHNVLKTAFQLANTRVTEAAQESPEYAGMGSTLVALWIRGDLAFFSHLGDSRLYLARNGGLEQLTADHSLIQEQISKGMITPEEARHNPFRHVVTQAIGQRERIDAQVQEIGTTPGDRFLLCSDGLTDKVPDEQICKMLLGSESPEAACRTLVDSANAAGGDDNVTVVCVWRSQ